MSEQAVIATSDIPELPGWKTFSDAAAMLGMTRQNVHLIAFGKDHKLGIPHRVGSGPKPVYVVREDKVRELLGQREIKADPVSG